MSEPAPRRPREGFGRPPLMIVLPLVIVLAIAAVWSVLWYEGTRRAEARLDAWLTQEAARGHSYDCAERSVGGYPFRVELNCGSPSAEFANVVPRITMRAEALRAVAMVWRLDHVIIELDGPMRLEAVDAEGEVEAAISHDWSVWQASIRAPEGRIRQFDVAVSDMSLAPDPATAPQPVDVTAEQFEMHGRQTQDGTAEFAFSAEEPVVAVDGAEPPDPVDVAFTGHLTALPEPVPSQPADFLAAWRKNDGVLVIEDARAVQGETILHAAGRLTPDPQGRPEGTVTVSLAGPDVATPGVGGAFGGIAPILATALRLAGRPSELDGREAVSGDIELRDGKIYFGPMPLGEIPPLL